MRSSSARDSREGLRIRRSTVSSADQGHDVGRRIVLRGRFEGVPGAVRPRGLRRGGVGVGVGRIFERIVERMGGVLRHADLRGFKSGYLRIVRGAGGFFKTEGVRRGVRACAVRGWVRPAGRRCRPIDKKIGVPPCKDRDANRACRGLVVVVRAPWVCPPLDPVWSGPERLRTAGRWDLLSERSALWTSRDVVDISFPTRSAQSISRSFGGSYGVFRLGPLTHLFGGVSLPNRPLRLREPLLR